MRAALARVACRRLLASRSPPIIAPRLLCTSSDQPQGTPIERQFSRAHNTESDEHAETPILESTFKVSYKGENKGEEQHKQFPAPDIQGRTIWVTGLEADTAEEPLIDAFRNCGAISEVMLVDDLRVLPKHEREREDAQRGTDKARVNTRAWSQMQPQVRRRAAFVTFINEAGCENALKPALQMLGVVIPLKDEDERKKRSGIVCRPHPAERRKTLIARYNDTEAFPDEISQSDDGLKRAPQLVQDVELLMKPYTFVHAVTLSRHNSVTCTLKCTDFAEARSMLEMLRSEARRLALDKKIEFDWALDKERERTGLTL